MKNSGRSYQNKRHAEMFPNIRVSKTAGGKTFIYDARKGRDVTTPVAQLQEDHNCWKILQASQIILRARTLDECLAYAEEHLLPK